MQVEKFIYVNGVYLDGVWTTGGTVFLICQNCHHWVRKVFTDTQGSICVCTCHRPSVAKLESELNGNGSSPHKNQGAEIPV